MKLSLPVFTAFFGATLLFVSNFRRLEGFAARMMADIEPAGELREQAKSRLREQSH